MSQGIEGTPLFFCTICHAFHEDGLPLQPYKPGDTHNYPVVPNTREQFVEECKQRGIPVKEFK